ESLVDMLFMEMRRTAASSWRTRLGGLLLRPALRGVASRLDYRRYGAAPLLGVRGAVFVAHGRSDAQAIENAIRTAATAVEQGMLDALSATSEAPAGHAAGGTNRSEAGPTPEAS